MWNAARSGRSPVRQSLRSCISSFRLSASAHKRFSPCAAAVRQRRCVSPQWCKRLLCLMTQEPFCFSHQLFKPLKGPEQRIAAHGQRTDAYALHGAACTVYVVRRDIFLPRKGKDFRANGISQKRGDRFSLIISYSASSR